MSGERSGTTTAPNRSTAIRTKLWTDTKEDASTRKACSLHKIWPRRLLISHESACKSDSRLEIENIGNNRSDRAMFAIKKSKTGWRKGNRLRVHSEPCGSLKISSKSSIFKRTKTGGCWLILQSPHLSDGKIILIFFTMVTQICLLPHKQGLVIWQYWTPTKRKQTLSCSCCQGVCSS